MRVRTGDFSHLSTVPKQTALNLVYLQSLERPPRLSLYLDTSLISPHLAFPRAISSSLPLTARMPGSVATTDEPVEVTVEADEDQPVAENAVPAPDDDVKQTLQWLSIDDPTGLILMNNLEVVRILLLREPWLVRSQNHLVATRIQSIEKMLLDIAQQVRCVFDAIFRHQALPINITERAIKASSISSIIVKQWKCSPTNSPDNNITHQLSERHGSPRRDGGLAWCRHRSFYPWIEAGINGNLLKVPRGRDDQRRSQEQAVAPEQAGSTHEQRISLGPKQGKAGKPRRPSMRDLRRHCTTRHRHSMPLDCQDSAAAY